MSAITDLASSSRETPSVKNPWSFWIVLFAAILIYASVGGCGRRASPQSVDALKAVDEYEAALESVFSHDSNFEQYAKDLGVNDKYQKAQDSLNIVRLKNPRFHKPLSDLLSDATFLHLACGEAGPKSATCSDAKSRYHTQHDLLAVKLSNSK